MMDIWQVLKNTVDGYYTLNTVTRWQENISSDNLDNTKLFFI